MTLNSFTFICIFGCNSTLNEAVFIVNNNKTFSILYICRKLCSAFIISIIIIQVIITQQEKKKKSIYKIIIKPTA